MTSKLLKKGVTRRKRRANRMPPICLGEYSDHREPGPPSPSFKNFPYRADYVVDGWSDGGLTLRAASIRGRSHQKELIPRQDDYAVKYDPDSKRLLIAVADGVSSAEQSHIAAMIAVRQAIEYLEGSHSEDAADIDWQDLFTHAAWALIEQGHLLYELAKDPVEIKKYFATTLTCLVVSKVDSTEDADGYWEVYGAGIGDASVWLVADNFERIAGGKEDDSGDGGSFAPSAVLALPRVPRAPDKFHTKVRSGFALIVGTDGVGDALGDGSGPLGEVIKSLASAKEPPKPWEFLRALDFSKPTFVDDRTLVVLSPTS